MPLHEGKAEEIQSRAVDEFDNCTKIDQETKKTASFMQFSMDFTEKLEVMEATGISLPDCYVRLKFIRAMKTDPQYNTAMVELLSQRPSLDLFALRLKLQGYADSLKDNYLSTSKNRQALITDSSSANTADSVAKDKRAAKRAAAKAKRLAKVAKEKTMPTDEANAAHGGEGKVKQLCFAFFRWQDLHTLELQFQA
jgi:hypothetical protein